MSKHVVKNVSLAMILCLMLALFAGCAGPVSRARQKEWVEKMNETFKKDEFTYAGPHSGEYGQEQYIADVKSKKYPENRIIVKELNGKLLTNYNSIRYRDEAVDYVNDYFRGRFSCDSYKVKYAPVDQFGPVIDYSFDEYYDECFSFNCVRIALISKNGNFPSDEEIAEEMLAIAKDRDEICSLYVHCIRDKDDDWVLDSDKYFELYMKEERKVNYIRVAHDEGKKTKFERIMENVTW